MKNNNKFLVWLVLAVATLTFFVTIKLNQVDSPLHEQGTNTAKIMNLPEATNYTVDEAGALTTEQLTALNEKLKTVDEVLGQEIGIAIVKTTGIYDIEQYGIKLAEKWKVGDEDLDNGIIIILATGDRKVRIEAGYGIEGTINDAKAGRIIDEYMMEGLKEGDWNKALKGGIEGIKDFIKY